MLTLLKRGLAALLFLCVPAVALAATITAADVGTTTSTGQGSVVIVSGTPTAGSFVQQSTGGSVAAMSVVVAGTFSGTLNFEASADGATTFAPVSCALVGSTTPASAATGDGTFNCPVGQASTLRVRASALSSGTPSVGISIYYHDVGTFGSGTTTTIPDGNDATLGAKADAKSAATDATPISIVSILKQISASVQAPPSQAVTNAGTFPVQNNATAATAYEGNVTSTKVAANASPTKLRTYIIGNSNSSFCYLQFFNLASANVTVGSTAPLFFVPVPALGGANLKVDFNFSVAMTIAATTTPTGSTNCTSGLDTSLLQD
jgi:hypothetical protein